MVTLILGTGHPHAGEMIRVHAVTLGEAIAKLEERLDGFDGRTVRYFVGGVDTERLEGEHTPVGDEDTVLVVPAST